MLLRYRGSEGMVAWAFHRISGLGIVAFVVLHVFDIFLAGSIPRPTTTSWPSTRATIGRMLEVLLGAALFYHALNGVRILLMDFWPRLTVYHKQIWYANWVIFFGVGLPGAFIIMRPALGL